MHVVKLGQRCVRFTWTGATRETCGVVHERSVGGTSTTWLTELIHHHATHVVLCRIPTVLVTAAVAILHTSWTDGIWRTRDTYILGMSLFTVQYSTVTVLLHMTEEPIRD